MTDGEGSAGTRRTDDDAKRQLRLLGVGFIVSGLVTIGLSSATDPGGILLPLLGILGLAALVLEGTQDVTHGISFGLFTGVVAVWLWPSLGSSDAGYASLGTMIVAIGLVNVLLAPIGVYFRRFGERLAGGRTDAQQEEAEEETES